MSSIRDQRRANLRSTLVGNRLTADNAAAGKRETVQRTLQDISGNRASLKTAVLAILGVIGYRT
jgi:hypothetical protein